MTKLSSCLARPGRLLVLLVVCCCVSSNKLLVTAKNMNDGRYVIANAMNSDDGDHKNKKKQYSTDYQAEFFDVYSPPIRSRYAQVFWAEMAPVPLPPEIVARFDNNNSKTMAIVGYEVDQVRRVPDKNGQLQDIPVPITHAYNHHYIAALTDDRQGRMVKKALPPVLEHAVMTHGTNQLWDFEAFDDDPQRTINSPEGIPHAQIFSEANGGEMRLSYHGYPRGYAQLIQSPNTFQINPMQIDTYNRDAPGPQFQPGPLPRASPLYNKTSQDGIPSYSGLLECPCSDAIERKWWYAYALLPTSTTTEGGRCAAPQALANATECFQAGRYVVPAPHIQTHIVNNNATNHSSSSVPDGCSLNQRATSGILDITWKEPSPARDGALPTTQKDEDEDVPPPQQVVAFASGAINATVTLTRPTDTVTLALVGPADQWFGIGFRTQTMSRREMQGDECPSGGPYAIVVYDHGTEERALDFHGMGHVLSHSTLTVVSNTVEGNHRKVVLQRPLEGPDDRYFTFDLEEASLPIIMATGCNMTLAQHCGHGASQLNFLATDTNRPVCRDGIQATIGGKEFDEGRRRCAPFPQSTLLEQGNPTCSVHTYQGGLHCCKHLQSLLDHDQETPWADQVLEYHMKFRYYFEEYTPAGSTTGAAAVVTATSRDQDNHQIATKSATATTTVPASHQNLVRFYWMTEAFAGEYDIVQCPPGTPTSQCIQVISSRWSVRQLLRNCDGPWCTGRDSHNADGIELIYAGPHCHAPSCLSMELYNADTGELLCHVEPRPGQSTDKVYDELGFLAIPPCLWGHEDGLMKPVFLSTNTTLLSIKRNNNTRAHFGEMASWQMRGVVVMDNKNQDKPGYVVDNDNNNKEHAVAVNDKIQTGETADLATDTQKTEPKTSIRKGRPEV